MSEARIVTPLGVALDADGFLARAELADGTEIGLTPQPYGTVLLTRGPSSHWTGWSEAWTFTDPSAALVAYAALVDDPSAAVAGWIRYRAARRPPVRRAACPVCGSILEYGDDDDGVAEAVL